MRILLVDDNALLAETVREGLREIGYVVDVASTGFDAEDLAIVEPYDLILLDVMLPDRDGTDVCRALRRRGITTPVLMLTALTSPSDTVAGLDAGADDYLGKPFDFEELIARVRALLRRGRATESATLRVADLELDLHKRSAVRSGQRIELTSREFALLEFLMRNPDRVLSRITIAEKVWDQRYQTGSNVIDVYISALRKKIDRGFHPSLIQTVIGAGYRFGSPLD